MTGEGLTFLGPVLAGGKFSCLFLSAFNKSVIHPSSHKFVLIQNITGLQEGLYLELYHLNVALYCQFYFPTVIFQ